MWMALAEVPTKVLTRPVVVMLATGYASHFHETDHATPVDGGARDFGEPERFEPQKVRAKRRAVGVIPRACAAHLLKLAFRIH